MNRLHWSIDYSHHQRDRDFAGELTRSLSRVLESPLLEPTVDRRQHRYTMLPNFWGGSEAGASHEEATAIGQLFVDRSRIDGGEWRYCVEHKNRTSGEALYLEFNCRDEPMRTLRTGWRIRTDNSADGSYSSISWTGHIHETGTGKSIVLETERGLRFSAGDLPPGAELIANWALVDVVPVFKDRAEAGVPVADGHAVQDSFAVLDDLELLRTNCRFKALDEWMFRTPDGAPHILEGWSLHGNGYPPTYWWLTAAGEVAIVSTMLATYVLVERG